MAIFNICRRGDARPASETHARLPSAPSKGWATTAIPFVNERFECRRNRLTA